VIEAIPPVPFKVLVAVAVTGVIKVPPLTVTEGMLV
jgi:hypothetical protein